MKAKPPVPPEKDETVRERLAEELRQAPATAKELSGLAGVPEKDVPEHLVHLEKSLKRKGKRLKVLPASCIACGFVFGARTRLTRPGKCPECGSTRIDPPSFHVEKVGAGRGDEEEE